MASVIRWLLGDKIIGDNNFIGSTLDDGTRKFENWAKTFSCQPERFFTPRTVKEIKEAIHLASTNNKSIRCAGGRASPSDIFCTEEYLLCMKQFNNILNIDEVQKTIKVESGCTLDKINLALDDKCLALPVLPSIGFPTIGGVLGTGVHGSGTEHHILPDYVKELELLTADGKILRCNMTQNSDVFKSALVNLGALGVVITVTIQCVEAYRLKVTTTSLPFFEGLDAIEQKLKNCSTHGKFLYYPNLDEIVAFDISKTNEKPRPLKPSLLWVIARKTGLLELFFLLCLTINKHLAPLCFKLIHFISFGKKTEPVDKNFKVLHFDCLFSQHVDEWCIPQEKTSDFLRSLRNGIKTRDLVVHGPVEVRFVKSSEAFLSPTYGRDSTYFNIVLFRPFGVEPFDKQPYWELYEELMLSYDGRPHWAKVHKMNREFFLKSYPKFKEFLSIREKLDPACLFVNDYLKRHILE